MTTAGETSVPTTTGPLDEVHREQSARLVDHLVDHGPATRSELAAATGLGRGAIAGLTSRLLDAGVLRTEAADAAGDHRTAPLTLAAADHVLVTAHLGPDDAVATIASLGGDELARFTAPLSPDPSPVDVPVTGPSPLELLAVVLGRAIARAERAERRIADVTVLVDGAVAGTPSIVLTDERLGVEPVDVLGELRARTPGLAEIEAGLPVPVALVPTAVAAASVELGGIASRDLFYLAGDTGIVAAAVVDGRPMRGAHGLAATFAHLPIVPGGVRCSCGQRGCLATVASPEIVLERAGLAGFAAANGRLAALDELVALVDAADDRARWSWLDAALWIGRSLQLVAPTLDPAYIVVGGYWAALVGDIETSFRDNRPTIGGGALESIPTIVASQQGGEAAVAGARRQARERLVSEPLLLAG